MMAGPDFRKSYSTTDGGEGPSSAAMAAAGGKPRSGKKKPAFGIGTAAVSDKRTVKQKLDDANKRSTNPQMKKIDEPRRMA